MRCILALALALFTGPVLADPLANFQTYVNTVITPNNSQSVNAFSINHALNLIPPILTAPPVVQVLDQNYTAAPTDRNICLCTQTATRTITLAPAAQVPSGVPVVVNAPFATFGTPATIAPNGTDLLRYTGTPLALGDPQPLTLYSNGTNGWSYR